jgi:hypothetical protein
MRRDELRRRIYRMIDDDPDSPASITEADVNELIDEALEVVSEEVRYRSKTAYVPLFPGAQFYHLHAIDPLCYSPVRFWLMDREWPLRFTTIGELNREENNWLDFSSDRPHSWFPVDHLTFGIYPRVTESSGEVLRIDYYAWDEGVANDSAILPYDNATLDAVVGYVAYSVHMRRYDMMQAGRKFEEFAALFQDSLFTREVRRFNHAMMARPSHDYSNRIFADR